MLMELIKDVARDLFTTVKYMEYKLLSLSENQKEVSILKYIWSMGPWAYIKPKIVVSRM